MRALVIDEKTGFVPTPPLYGMVYDVIRIEIIMGYDGPVTVHYVDQTQARQAPSALPSLIGQAT